MSTNEIAAKQPVAETFSAGQLLAETFTLKQRLSIVETGILWLAHDAGTDKDVALLFLPDEIPGDSRAMEELRTQVKLNRQLIHPHVLRTYDLIEEQEWAAISFDAVEAETLASLLAQKENGCFDPSAIQPWISTLCQTLDDAHRAGLLHRDLVPQNILLTKSGGILIANFGISRIILDALAHAPGRRNIDEHLGSVSPQQLDGELPARWDDVYALGALIYQLLTGKPPFYSGDLVAQIRKSIPPPLSGHRAELGIQGEPIPAGWDKVVAACLEKQTAQRPKSAREVGVKLAAESLVAAQPPAPSAARTETSAKVEAPPAREIEKSRRPPEPASAEIREAAPAETHEIEEAGEIEDGGKSLAEDVVWRKPGQQKPPVEPGQPLSFKHLLEKLPEEDEGKKQFPYLKAAVIIAFIVVGAWTFFILSKKELGVKPDISATSATSATPAPTAAPPQTNEQSVENPAESNTPTVAAASATPAAAVPQVRRAEPVETPAVPSPAPSREAMIPLDQARKAVEETKKEVDEKTAAQQQAQSDLTAAQSALQAQAASLEAMKKTADETAILRKQREDAEAKAAADAAKSASDLTVAQNAADEKARVLADATKAKEQTLEQIKEQDEERQAAEAKVKSLQQAAADKQAAADAAAKAEKDAADRLQAQQVLLMQAQPAPAPAPQPAGSGSLASSGSADTLMPITPGKSPPAAPLVESPGQTNTQPAAPGVTTGSAPAPSVPITYIPNPKSQIDHTLTNSLGMKFQPVGDVLFCIWLTRVQDFEVFAKETHFKGNSWLQPGFKQGPDDPVVYVTWGDAMAFCKWLTDKERKTGLLAPNQLYRLPTDLEWSKAVGLPEEPGKTPDDRDVGVKDVYPWGTQWPPPPGAGNYAGEETGSEVSIKGYNDGFVYTSPVSSFAMNKYGLYDMGGNAWEWCMDWFNGAQKQKVLRGASWYNGDLQLSLLSSCRWASAPELSADDFSFRCVVATEGRTKK